MTTNDHRRTQVRRLLLLVAFGTACASHPAPDAATGGLALPSLDEHDFALDPSLRAHPRQVVMVRLTPGVDHVLPFTFPRELPVRLCWSDDGAERHRATLVPSKGGVALFSIRSGEACTSIAVPPGDHDLVLRHDPAGHGGGGTEMVFVRLDPEGATGGGRTASVPALSTNRCEGCVLRFPSSASPADLAAPPSSGRASLATPDRTEASPAAAAPDRPAYCTDFNTPSYPYSLCTLPPGGCGDSQMTDVLDPQCGEKANTQVLQCLPGWPFFRTQDGNGNIDDNDFMNYVGAASLAGGTVRGRPSDRFEQVGVSTCGHAATVWIGKPAPLLFIGLDLSNVQFVCDATHFSDLRASLFYGNNMTGTRFTSGDGTNCGLLNGAVFEANTMDPTTAIIEAGWTVDGVIVDGAPATFLASASASPTSLGGDVSLLSLASEWWFTSLDRNGCPACAKLGGYPGTSTGVSWSKVADLSGSTVHFQCAFDTFATACGGPYAKRGGLRRLHASKIQQVPWNHFKASTLSGLDVGDATLQWVGLDGVTSAPPDASNARFSNAILSRVHFSGGTLDGATFDACRMQGAQLQQASLKGATFKNATDISAVNATGANLTSASMKSVVGDQADPRIGKTILDDATLDGADFTGAHFGLYGSSGATTSMAGVSTTDLKVTFTGAILDGVDMTGASFVPGADFSSASGQSIILNGAVLNDATLNGADFTGATLTNVSACGASIEGLKLNGANLTGAYFPGHDPTYVIAPGYTYVYECAAVSGVPVTDASTTCPDGLPGDRTAGCGSPATHAARWMPGGYDATEAKHCFDLPSMGASLTASACQYGCDCKSYVCSVAAGAKSATCQ